MQTRLIRSYAVLLILLSLVIALLLVLPSLIMANEDAPLFVAVEETARLTDADPSNQILRSRTATTNLHQLTQSNTRTNASLQLNLFDDANFVAIPDAITRHADGQLLWRGSLEGAHHSSVLFVVRDGVMTGLIEANHHRYRILSNLDGTYTIEELDRDWAWAEGEPIPIDLPPSSTPNRAVNDDGTVIDILVAYTDGARQHHGSTTAMLNAIDLAIADANQIYQNSRINTQLNLVHTVEVNYNASSSMSNDLGRIQKTSDGIMDSLHSLRDTYKADLVHLIVEEADSGLCGVAYLMSSLSAGFEEWAFGVTRTDCLIGSYTLAHEVGHNMGSEHDPNNAQGSPLTNYSYGFWEPGYNWRTVMAYNCPSRCPQVPHFSNPDVNYNGATTGVRNSQDNARSMSSVLYTMANFRVGNSGPPPASGTISVRVLNSLDDVEERNSDGDISVSSSDLELINDSGLRGEQTVGIRFQNITVPQGATITNAHLEFTTDEADSTTTNIVIHGEDTDSAAAFVDSAHNVSGRTTTNASVNWNIGAWSTIGNKHQSPSIQTIVQEIVNRGGWQSGGNMAFVITGSGERTAESYDGDSAAAPLLVIEYESIAPTPTPSPTYNGTSTVPTPTPTLDPSSAISFAVIGDFGTDDSREEAVATLVASWAPEFIATVGDNVYGSHTFDEAVGKYYCDFVKDVTPDDNPATCNGGNSSINRFFPSTGNHDHDDGPTGDLSDYVSYFKLPGDGIASSNTSGNELYYDVIIGSVHLFILDSETISNQGGAGSPSYNAQRAWLQTQVAASNIPWKLVLVHHPPYSSARHGSNSWMQWPYAEWGVDAVLAGHDHVYERIVRDDMVYFVNGMGGRTFYDFETIVSGSAVRYNGANGAMRVFANDRSMSLEFIDVAQTVIDRYELGAPLPTPTPTVTPELPNAGAIDVRVASSNDDVEQRESDGDMYFTSSDLEIGDDPGYWGDQEVGLRFQDVALPANATITEAYLEFVVEASDSETTDVQIRGQSADSAPAFTSTAYDLTSRATTSAAVNWSIPAWNTIGGKQQSPELKAIVQEIVDRPGWQAFNDMVFVITGSGQRSAESYDADPSLAPLLHIVYSVQGEPTPSPTVTPSPTPELSPTPSPTPGMMHLEIGDYHVGSGGLVSVTLNALDVAAPGIGAATINVVYDSTVLDAVSCSADPNSTFDIRLCNPDAASNKLSLAVTESGNLGAIGDTVLGELVFQAIGSVGDSSALTIEVITLVDANSNLLVSTLAHGNVVLSERGDVTCDGTRNIIDAQQIMQYVVGIRTAHDDCTLPANTIYTPLCDVNNDNLCDTTDALFIVQCAVNFSNALCPSSRAIMPSAASNTATRIGITAQPVSVGEAVTLPITATVPTEDKLFSGTIALYYDPLVVEATGCSIDSSLMGACNVAFDNDGVAPDIVMFTLIAPTGVSGSFSLADVTFTGRGAGSSDMTLEAQALRNGSGEALTVVEEVYGTLEVSAVSRIQLRETVVDFGRNPYLWITTALLVTVGILRYGRRREMID